MPKGVKWCKFCRRYVASRAFKKHYAECEKVQNSKRKYTNPMLENRINPNLTAMGRRRKFR